MSSKYDSKFEPRVGMTRGEIKNKISERLSWYKKHCIYFQRVSDVDVEFKRLLLGWNLCWEPEYEDMLSGSNRVWRLWVYQGTKGPAGCWNYSDWGPQVKALVSRMVDWLYDLEGEKKL